MPSRYCLLFLLFFFLNEAAAQKFSAGIVAGIAGTQVDGDRLDGYHKAGLVAGALSAYRFSPRWSAQFEILYIQKGSRSNFDSTGTSTFYLLRLHYIEVPVVIQYHFGPKRRWLMESGLSFAQLLDYHEEIDFTSYTDGNFHSNDYCFILGLGYAFTKRLILQARYEYSIIPIRQNTFTKRGLFGYGQFNNVIGFTLRYYFKDITE